MKELRRWEILFANLAWLLACLPGTVAFLCAVVFPRRAQRQLLRRTLQRAGVTKFGRQHGFDRMVGGVHAFQAHPIAGYDAFRPFVDAIQAGETNVLTPDVVTLLQPTSGTSAPPKLIPLTAGLQRQFQAALAPWIASLYLLRPRLLLGRQYWCLSPNTRPAQSGFSAVPIGFADDAEYLGAWQRWFAARLLVAPPQLARVEDPATFEFLTLLFLARERNLRLISVWHPSFLTLLLNALPRQVKCLADCLRTGVLPAGLVLSAEMEAELAARMQPDLERAADLEDMTTRGVDFGRLWPHLQVISCWTERHAESSVARLRAAFPGVTIQSKGLLATEGVVTIPWGFSGRHLAAVRSHFLEFIECQTSQVKQIWDLRVGQIYTVVLTTAGGLYRYHLLDRVRVTNFWARTPCLECLGREGLVSDICGEKLTGDDVEVALEHLSRSTGVCFEFAMVVPDWSEPVPGYVCIVEVSPASLALPSEAWSDVVDELLQRNFHYAHARRLGQLRPLTVLPVRNAASVYRTALVRRGQQCGSVKFPPLCQDSGWVTIFKDQHLKASTPLAP